MKKYIIFPVLAIIAVFASCEKDAGLLPNIAFKKTTGYVSRDTTVSKDSVIVIGINASKSEDKDVLKKFNISESVNGGTSTSVYTADLTGAEGDSYSYDFTPALGTTAGIYKTWTFTVTNRDGLVNQVSVKVTLQ